MLQQLTPELRVQCLGKTTRDRLLQLQFAAAVALCDARIIQLSQGFRLRASEAMQGLVRRIQSIEGNRNDMRHGQTRYCKR
jgi:hypothetical protein